MKHFYCPKVDRYVDHKDCCVCFHYEECQLRDNKGIFIWVMGCGVALILASIYSLLRMGGII